MIRIQRSVFIFLLLSFAAAADELPTLRLNEGLNEISISIINNWDRDISRLTFYVNSKLLPEWLSVLDYEKAIDIRKGTNVKNKLILKLFVKEKSINDAIELPLTLRDNAGNSWVYQVKFKIGTGNPTEYALHNNFPNPFNPTTTIKYSLKENIHAKLTIYNIMGQVVRTLVDEKKLAGEYSIKWYACNDNGEKVFSGIYFYRLEAGKFKATKRMMFVR